MTTTKPRADLAAALKRAAAPTVDTAEIYKARTAASTTAAVREKTFDKMQDNPFYQIAASKESGLRLPNQKRDAMIKLLSYDITKTAEENEAMTRAYMTWLDYMEAESLRSSKGNIAGQNAKVSAELKRVIDQFSRGVSDFKAEIGPFTRRLDAIYNIRLSGRAVELLEEIIQDRKAIEEGKKLLVDQTAQLEREADKLADLTSEIKRTQRQVAELGESHRFGLSFLGLKSSARRELAAKEVDLAGMKASSAEQHMAIDQLRSSVQQIEATIGTPRDTQFGELAEDKVELQTMLDISDEEHVAAHENLKSRTLEFIETSETRIDAVLGNVQEVNTLTAKTAKKNGAMVITSAIMNEAVKRALVNDQETLSQYEPPQDPASEDEIAKAEREETRTAVLRHIKSVTMADSGTTNLRSSLTRTNDLLGSMLQANEERIRATKQLRTSGISNMAAEMAITMTALADASNAEALHMSQTMVDEMSETVIGIRNKEVMRQAAEMGIRNEQLAALIVATQQADRIARVGIEEQRRALTDLNKNLAGVTDVTADLQETLKASEAVYAEAQRAAAEELAESGPRVASNDDVPRSRREAGGGPAPDPFA